MSLRSVWRYQSSTFNLCGELKLKRLNLVKELRLYTVANSEKSPTRSSLTPICRAVEDRSQPGFQDGTCLEVYPLSFQ
ncbi:hypothetical protein AgCh_022269 [Apium graveolens]